MSNNIKYITGIKDNHIILDKSKDKFSEFADFTVLNCVQNFNSPKRCHNCGFNMVKNGKTPQVLILCPKMAAKPLYMGIRKQKFICKNCHSTRVFPILGVEEHCSISNYVKQQIVVNFKRTTSMKDTAFEYSVSSNTVQRCLESTEDTLNRVKKSLPNAIALDDFNSSTNITDKMSMLLINADTHETIDVIRSRRDAALRSYFLRHYSRHERQKVRFVIVDLYQPYRNLIHDLFPNAKIIADKYHVVLQVSRVLQSTRIAVIRKFGLKSHEGRALKRYWKLLMKDSTELDFMHFNRRPNFKHSLLCDEDVVNRLLEMDEELKDVYNYYQEVLYALRSKDAERFSDIINQKLSTIPSRMRNAHRTLRKHKEEILLTLTYNYTNGPIEGKMNKIKVLKRVAFGFRSFKNFRLRILLSSQATTLNIKEKKSKKITAKQLVLQAT